jgi:hypothetical protein
MLRATVRVPGGDEEETIELGPERQWRELGGNVGPLALFSVLFPGSRDLASVGDPRHYLECFHGLLTDAKLHELATPPEREGEEPRERGIDRIAALRVIAADRRAELEPSVVALLAPQQQGKLDPFTRRAAEETLAELRGKAPPPLPAAPQPSVTELASLPAWSDLVIAVDQQNAPVVTKAFAAYRRFSLALVASAMRNAGAVRPAQMGYALFMKDAPPAFFPMVVARAGNARIDTTAVGIGLGHGAGGPRPGARLPEEFCCVLTGLFEHEAFARHAQALAEHDPSVEVVSRPGGATIRVRSKAKGADAAPLEMALTGRSVRVSSRAADAPLGEERATALVERWRARVPRANAVWAHARLPDQMSLDVGLRAGPAELRIDVVLECADAEAAQAWLERARAVLEPPKEPGPGAGQELEMSALRKVWGKPELTVDGATLRGTLAVPRSLDDLLAAWIDEMRQAVQSASRPK